jgi:hypothetical protein
MGRGKAATGFLHLQDHVKQRKTGTGCPGPSIRSIPFYKEIEQTSIPGRDKKIFPLLFTRGAKGKEFT